MTMQIDKTTYCEKCGRQIVHFSFWSDFWFHASDGSLACVVQRWMKENIDQSGSIEAAKMADTEPRVKWHAVDYGTYRRELSALERRVDKLVVSATDALDALKGRIDSLVEVVHDGMVDKEGSIDSLRIKIESIENRMAATDEENSEIDAYNERNQAEFEQFKGMVDDILKRLEPLENRSDTLENVDARLQTMEEFAESDDREERLQELEQDKVERDEYNEVIKKYNAKIQADYYTLKTTVTDLTRDVWYLKTASTMLNQRVDTLTKTVDWFSAEPSDAEVEEGSGIENRLAEVESFKERVEDWVDGADRQFAELRLLEQKVKTLTNIITKLNAEPLKTAAERRLAANVENAVKRLDYLDKRVSQSDWKVGSITTRLAKVEEFMQMADSDDDDQTED